MTGHELQTGMLCLLFAMVSAQVGHCMRQVERNARLLRRLAQRSGMSDQDVHKCEEGRV